MVIAQNHGFCQISACEGMHLVHILFVRCDLPRVFYAMLQGTGEGKPSDVSNQLRYISGEKFETFWGIRAILGSTMLPYPPCKKKLRHSMSFEVAIMMLYRCDTKYDTTLHCQVIGRHIVGHNQSPANHKILKTSTSNTITARGAIGSGRRSITPSRERQASSQHLGVRSIYAYL